MNLKFTEVLDLEETEQLYLHDIVVRNPRWIIEACDEMQAIEERLAGKDIAFRLMVIRSALHSATQELHYQEQLSADRDEYEDSLQDAKAAYYDAIANGLVDRMTDAEYLRTQGADRP